MQPDNNKVSDSALKYITANFGHMLAAYSRSTHPDLRPVLIDALRVIVVLVAATDVLYLGVLQGDKLCAATARLTEHM